MKIKIVSDGSVTGTKVVDADSGELIENVTQVAWQHGAKCVPLATLDVVCPAVDAIGQVDVINHGDYFRTYVPSAIKTVALHEESYPPHEAVGKLQSLCLLLQSLEAAPTMRTDKAMSEAAEECWRAKVFLKRCLRQLKAV